MATLPAARLARALAALAFLATLLPANLAAAADDDVPRDIMPARKEDAKRPLPDYDGRGTKGATVGEVLIWGPRIVAAPLYIGSEYIVRRPIGAVIIATEQSKLTATLTDFFTFDKEHKIGLVPTAFIDFGFLPSVGAYFFWDDFIAKKNDLRLHVGTWGPDWLKGSITDRIHLSETSTLSLRAEGSRRRDWRFYGLGPRSLDSASARYSADILEAGPSVDHQITHGLRFNAGVGVRAVSFDEAACCAEETVGQRVKAGQIAAVPPGFNEGYTIGYQHMQVTFDTRPMRPLPQHGIRLTVHGDPAFNFRRAPGNAWFKYGATVAGYVDITGHNRVLSLHVTTLFVDPLSGVGSAIPFREQILLGGTEYMRGYLLGRLIDRSAFITTLQYQWPIWVWLDGTMHVAAGNVFGAGLKDMAPRLFRISSGIGLRTNTSQDNQFEILAGFGTETFADGAKITSFRLALGATHGF